MTDPFDQLKTSWKEVQRGLQPADSSAMLQLVKDNYNKSKQAHIWNASILIVVVIGLAAFFYFVAPMQELLSRIGIGLMVGGLIIRIIIELISHRKASRIDYAATSKRSTNQTQEFYTYRKRIHGPVTLSIIALYSIGFYVLTPEFSLYLPTFWLWVMDIGYLFIGLVLFWVIRKGVVAEMNYWKQLTNLQAEMYET